MANNNEENNNEENKNDPIKKVNTMIGKKIQRNDICPCGSGKKYKFCHGN